MDNSGPRSGSVTPNSGSGYPFERPLPPIPGPDDVPVSWSNEGAAGVARPSNPVLDQYRVDTSGIYDEDVTGEVPEINLHGVDGSLLDIYSSRSNSSLSVTSPDLLTRAPYLEGVSNSSPRPSVVFGDHSAPRGDSPELSRSYQSQSQNQSQREGQREWSGAASNSAPVSLREFLGDGPSTARTSAASPARASDYGLNSSEDSLVQSRTVQGRPRGAVWGESSSENAANVSVRTPTRTLPRQTRSGVDDTLSSGSLGDSPLLDRGSLSQVRHQLRPSPPPPSEFVVPRWQPDAEVTFCPICRTQFSKCPDRDDYARELTIGIGFFVRKHHCRYALPHVVLSFCSMMPLLLCWEV
jgi:hypothetical protein